MFEHDTVLIPKETSWFGYYPDGAFEPILPTQKTELYTEDWIGLKTLDDAGKVKYVKVAGNHLQISSSDMKKHVVPYLAGNASTDGSFVNVEHMASHDLQDDASSIFTFEGSSSYKWPAPVNTFFAELVGLTIDQQSIDA